MGHEEKGGVTIQDKDKQQTCKLEDIPESPNPGLIYRTAHDTSISPLTPSCNSAMIEFSCKLIENELEGVSYYHHL